MFCILLPHANFNACMLTASQYFQYFDYIHASVTDTTQLLHAVCVVFVMNFIHNA